MNKEQKLNLKEEKKNRKKIYGSVNGEHFKNH